MKRTLKKFNFSDVVIIVGLLAIVCGLLFRTPIEKLLTDLFYQKNVEYTVSVSAGDARLLSEGLNITNAQGESLGTVKFIKPDTSSRDENGIINGYNITIETVGMTDKLGTYIGDSQFIAPRMTFEFYSETGDPISCVVKKVESDG